MQFDPNIPPYIGGDITTVVVQDPASTFPPLEVGNRVLDRKKAFEVKVRWEIQGSLAPLWLAALQTADWDVSAYAESIGGGSEVRLGTTKVAVDPLNLTYEATINVAPLTLDEHTPNSNQSGVYKLVVAVFLDSTLGAPGFDMVGFAEGPYVQVEDPI